MGATRSRDVREFIGWLESRGKWRGGKALNIGIGDCQEALILRMMDGVVTGITNSQDEADNARQLGIQAYCMDAHQMKFENESFDIIYMHDTMEHFISPIMVFTQFRRVLKPGGILGFHYPTMSQSHDWTHWFIESPRLMFDWLLKFGFKLLHFAFNPDESSEFLYIAEKVVISQDEYDRGANVVHDMLRELDDLYNTTDI